MQVFCRIQWNSKALIFALKLVDLFDFGIIISNLDYFDKLMELNYICLHFKIVYFFGRALLQDSSKFPSFDICQYVGWFNWFGHRFFFSWNIHAKIGLLERVKIIIFQTVFTNTSENLCAERSDISWKLRQDLTAELRSFWRSTRPSWAELFSNFGKIVLIRESEKLTKFPFTKGLPQIIHPSPSPPSHVIEVFEIGG